MVIQWDKLHRTKQETCSTWGGQGRGNVGLCGAGVGRGGAMWGRGVGVGRCGAVEGRVGRCGAGVSRGRAMLGRGGEMVGIGGAMWGNGG